MITSLEERPFIAEVVSRYTSLPRSGRELTGLCPFHQEKTPSFSVNEERGVFHCFGCGSSGDVIRFIELIEHLDFKQALAHLGLSDSSTKPDRDELQRRAAIKKASEAFTSWMREVSDRIAAAMRDIGQRAVMARKVQKEPEADREFLTGEIERCREKWRELEVLHDKLADPSEAVTLWRERESIESLISEETYSPPDPFPALTETYREKLSNYVQGSAS